MIFFQASTAFVQWLVKYANGRIMLECGCGDADLLRGVSEAQGKIIGLEPFWFDRPGCDLLLPVLPTTVQRYKPLRTSPHLIIVARPDHGGWLEWICRHADPRSEVLYIGKPENLDVDLPGWKTAVLPSPQCPEERVYQVDRSSMPDSEPALDFVDCLGLL